MMDWTDRHCRYLRGRRCLDPGNTVETILPCHPNGFSIGEFDHIGMEVIELQLDRAFSSGNRVSAASFTNDTQCRPSPVVVPLTVVDGCLKPDIYILDCPNRHG